MEDCHTCVCPFFMPCEGFLAKLCINPSYPDFSTLRFLAFPKVEIVVDKNKNAIRAADRNCKRTCKLFFEKCKECLVIVDGEAQ